MREEDEALEESDVKDCKRNLSHHPAAPRGASERLTVSDEGNPHRQDGAADQDDPGRGREE
jgi:hypothetical protein